MTMEIEDYLALESELRFESGRSYAASAWHDWPREGSEPLAAARVGTRVCMELPRHDFASHDRPQYHVIDVVAASAVPLKTKPSSTRTVPSPTAPFTVNPPFTSTTLTGSTVAPAATTTLAVGLVWASIGWRSLFEHVAAVEAAPTLEAARSATARIVGRDVAQLEWPDLRRAALESLGYVTE